MANVKFKYTINEQISLLPRNILIRDIEKILKKAGILKATFHRDRNLFNTSETSIPSDRLQIYAKLFECTLDDLIAKSEVKGKSIREQLLPQDKPKQKSKIKSGLA